MTQPSLFDVLTERPSAARWSKGCSKRQSGQQLKRRGMEKAAAHRATELWRVQALARGLGLSGDITIEDVRKRYEEWEMETHGPWDLGNAAGSVFKGSEWECVGYREATRPEAHARILRVWRLKK